MSALVYGNLTRRRLDTPQGDELVFAEADEGTKNASGAVSPVKPWIDALTALVPAEALAIHGVAMSFGTTTTGSGGSAVTKITYPDQMVAVYVALLVLTMVLVFTGAKTAKGLTIWLSAFVAAAAFVAWTMIQPSTAFDAFPFNLTGFGRTMIAVFLAVALGLISAALSRKATKDAPTA